MNRNDYGKVLRTIRNENDLTILLSLKQELLAQIDECSLILTQEQKQILEESLLNFYNKIRIQNGERPGFYSGKLYDAIYMNLLDDIDVGVSYDEVKVYHLISVGAERLLDEGIDRKTLNSFESELNKYDLTLDTGYQLKLK